MTRIVGTVEDVALDGITGTMWIWSGYRPGESGRLIAPRRTTWDITEGDLPDDVEVAEGPAVIELDMGFNARVSFQVMIPDEDEVLLRDLFSQSYVWEPYIIVETAENAEAARRAQEAAEEAQRRAEDARDDTVGYADASFEARSRAEAAQGAAEQAQGLAEVARDDARGHAVGAGESEAAAGVSAADSLTYRDEARAARDESREARDQSEGARDASLEHAQTSEGHAGDSATAADRAGDERIAAQDAKVRADEHANRSRDEADRSEAAADVAESYRWILRGEWAPGNYETGDVVVHEERAWRTPEPTSAEPPASPWVPLTPSPPEGVTHWGELDGKPLEFPPEAHTHDAGDVSGEATPLLDVSEASVGDASVAEALDGKSDSVHTHSISDVDGLEGTLDALEAGKADADHGHSISDVDGLEDALDEASQSGSSVHAMTRSEFEGITPDPDSWYIILAEDES